MSLEKAQEIAERISSGTFDLTASVDALEVILDFIKILVDRIETLESEMDEPLILETSKK